MKDASYLKFMTDKLQASANHSNGWTVAMNAVTAADIHRDCDTTSIESVVKHLSQLTLEQLEMVGI